MKIALMIVAVVVIVAIAGSMIYYYVFFRTEKEKVQIKIQQEELKLQQDKLEFEKEKQKAEEQQRANEALAKMQEEATKSMQEQNKKTDLAKALSDLEQWYSNTIDQAYTDYLRSWNEECDYRGLKPDCRLPTDVANRLTEDYDQEIKRIDQLYQSDKDNLFKLYE